MNDEVRERVRAYVKGFYRENAQTDSEIAAALGIDRFEAYRALTELFSYGLCYKDYYIKKYGGTSDVVCVYFGRIE